MAFDWHVNIKMMEELKKNLFAHANLHHHNQSEFTYSRIKNNIHI